ncbi:MAG: sulfatase-like hydrolase/transferase [Verrucomicrobiota bacterium]
MNFFHLPTRACRSGFTGLIFGLLLNAPLQAASAVKATPEKPNILIILADDLGYGDVQCYNPERGKIPTPNMDGLAAQGMRFTDGHSSAAGCTPSRYSLITGRYDWRSSCQRGVFGGFGGPPLIKPERLTIAGLAKQSGYRTAVVGKWHIGWDWPVPKSQYQLLGTESFEAIQKRFVDEGEPPCPSIEELAENGFYKVEPMRSYKTPVPTEEQLAAWKNFFSKPIGGGPTAHGFDSYYGVDAPGYPPYCFIENDRTVGIPTQFLPADKILPGAILGECQGPTVKDWDFEAVMPMMVHRACSIIEESAKTKDPFLLFVALPAPHQPWAVPEEKRKKSGLTLYCDWVMETDAVVGQLIRTLDGAGIGKNTLVILCSDNGYSPYGVAQLKKLGHWASGPLNGYKATPYEGGHREPFIVRWPAVVKAGSVCKQLVQQTDIMATMAEIFATKLPENAGEDSFSFLPLLKGEDRPVRSHVVNHSGQGGYGIRQGDWKLILEVDRPDPPKLFNLAEDLGEEKNLAAKYPEKVAELRALMAKLVADGRSTLGAQQPNDVPVRWLRKCETPEGASQGSK